MEKGIWETVDSTEWGELMWSQIQRIGQATPEKEQSAAHILPARGYRLVVPPRGSNDTAHRHQGWCSDTYNHTAKHLFGQLNNSAFFAECFQSHHRWLYQMCHHIFNGQTYFIRWAISNQSFNTLPLISFIYFI